MYFAVPGIVLAVMVGWAVAVSYRTQRRSTVVLIWIAITLAAVLLPRLVPVR
jgi:hypothetical protein